MTRQPPLVVCPHPLLAAAGREFITAEFLPGESIADYLARQNIHLGRQSWVLTVDGIPVEREWWGRVRPKPGTLIVLRATVHGGGGGGGGKNPLKTVLSIALMVVAPQLGMTLASSVMGSQIAATTFLFGTSITGAMIGSAIVSIAGSLVIGALTQPPAPKLSQVNGSYNAEQVSPTYALTGGSNRARTFEPLPLLLGEHRIFADYGAKYYTEFEGDDQYLYQIFNFGIGTTADLELTIFKIGETPMGSYSDVEIFEAGTDGKLPQMPGNVDTLSGGALTAAAGWIERTSSVDATALAIDLQGQLYRAGEGGLDSLGCNIEAQYRLAGAGTWAAWFNETLTSASRKPIRRTWRMNVAQGQYEIRVRRVTADETDARNISEFSWAALRTYQPDIADYTGQRRVGLRIKASGQLQGQVEQFNAIGRRLVPVWNGLAWVTAISDNPAWLYLWFARGGSIGGRPVFGVGLPDGRIDIDALKLWAAWCADEGLSFNAIFDQQRSRADMLDTIARCGRGSPSWATGKLGVVWDAADQPAVAVYGMANIVAGSFRVLYATEKMPDEVVLNFFNRETWQQDHVRVVVPGFAEGYTPQRPVTIELFGCTDKAMAGAEANLIAASQRYHRRRVQWESDFEGMVAQRGDVAMLSNDLTQWGYSGRLVAATASVLTLDRRVSYSSGSPYIGVRHPDGSYHVRAVTAFSGERDVLTLTSALPWNPGEDAGGPVFDYTYVFAPQATPGRRVKIVGVPSIKDGGARVRFEAVDDDPDYYASKNNPYIWTPPASALGGLPTVTNLRVTEELIRAGSGYAVRLELTWDTTGDYATATVLVGDDASALRSAGETHASRYEVIVPDAGQTVTLKVMGADGAGRSDPLNGSATIAHTVLGKSAPPASIANFTIDSDTLRWSAVGDIDLDGYLIRWQPGSNRSWGDAQPLHAGLIVSSPYTMLNRPSGPVTLMIKAVDTSGNESASAAAIITALGDPLVANVVATTDYHADGFTGIITNGTVDGGTGDLLANADASPLMWRANEASNMWADDSAAPMWVDVTYGVLAYQDGFTIAAADAGAQVTIASDIDGTYIIEWRPDGLAAMWGDSGAPMWSDDAAPMWTQAPWAPWPGTAVAVPGRYEIRASVADGAVHCRIAALAVNVDVPDLMETLADIAIASGGTRLALANSYRAIRAVNLTLQTGAGSALTAKAIDKTASLGPLIQCFDSSNAATTATVDAIIQGY